MGKKPILFQKENTTELTLGIGHIWVVIKTISVLCMCFAFLIGCGEDDDMISENPTDLLDNLPDLDDLEVREHILMDAYAEENLLIRVSESGEELIYAPNQDAPYTGWVKWRDAISGDPPWWGLWQAKDGKRHGIYLLWDPENQQNLERGFYKDGFRDGLWNFWTENGEKYNGIGLGGVKGLVFSPDGKTIASEGVDHTIRLSDVATGASIRTIVGHTSSVYNKAFSPDGKTIASGSEDGTIRLWDVATGVSKRTLEGLSDSVSSIAFNPDGKTLASGSGDGTIRLWDVATGVSVQILEGHTGAVYNVAFSPDGKTLASRSISDENILLWDVETGVIKNFLRHSQKGYISSSISFSTDGKTLASSGEYDRDSSTILLWDVVTGVNMHTWYIRGEIYSNIVFSPDGKTLASGSIETYYGKNSSIRLWDVVTKTHKHTWFIRKVNIHNLAFSPDGKTLAIVCHDDTIRFWDIP